MLSRKWSSIDLSELFFFLLKELPAVAGQKFNEKRVKLWALQNNELKEAKSSLEGTCRIR